MGALLEEAGLIHHQHPTRVAQVLDHIVAQVVADLVSVPAGMVEQPLHPIRSGVAGLLGQLPAVLAVRSTEQTVQEPASAAADRNATNPRRQPLAQPLQLGRPVLDLLESGLHAAPRFGVHEAGRLPQQSAAVVLLAPEEGAVKRAAELRKRR
jgi:hypothetical protein